MSDYKFYRVGPGPVLNTIISFFSERNANIERCRAIIEKHGANNVKWSSAGISCIDFDDKPDPKLWKKAKKSGGYEPSMANPDRESILEEWKTAVSMGAGTLQDWITGRDSSLTFVDTLNQQHFMAVNSFKVDDVLHFILMVPYAEGGFIDWKNDTGTSENRATTMEPWPVHESLTQIKKSEYFALIGQ